MKSRTLVVLSAAWTAVLIAAPPEQVLETAKPQPSPEKPQPAQNLNEVKVERPVSLDKGILPEDRWTEAKNGVIGQFLQSPNVLAPINPMAKPEAGIGAPNLSRDTVTGRIMGLHFLKFEL